MQSLTLIKLGGSVITNKEVPMMVREQVLTRLVREIKKAIEKHRQDDPDALFIIGHGQGSFAHAPAMRYRTKEGFVSKDSQIGMAITQDSAAQLNRIVVKNFIGEEVPAVSFYMSNALVTTDNQAKHFCGQVLEEYLAKGLVPITGGDVIADSKKGCTIWSTENVLGYLAQHYHQQTYQVERLIHVTEVAGVLDAADNVIPKISRQNSQEIKKLIGQTKGFDVTGGMWHKIEESLDLADRGIESVIINGTKKNNLYDCLVGNEYQGTKISAEG